MALYNIYYTLFAISGLLGVYFLHISTASLIILLANKGLGHYSPIYPILSNLLLAATFGSITVISFFLKEYSNALKTAIFVQLIPYTIGALIVLLLIILSYSKIRWN